MNQALVPQFVKAVPIDLGVGLLQARGQAVGGSGEVDEVEENHRAALPVLHELIPSGFGVPEGLFGHASPDLSAHYIGLDLDELKGALDRFGSFLGTRSPPTSRDRR